MSPLLEVERIGVEFEGGRGPTVSDLSLHVDRGELLALVGASGSGKSLTALAILRLLPTGARLTSGSMVRLDGVPITSLDAEPCRLLRGRRMAMVFQDPWSALTPALPVGRQLEEVLQTHNIAHGDAARARATALLAEMELPDPAHCLEARPHELSGGQRQRVLLALALAAGPDLLIADEPTSALDVTVQAQLLALLDRLRRERGLGVLLITHDLGIVAERADRMVVLEQGRVVEHGPTAQLLGAPGHPATQALVRASGRTGATVPTRLAMPAATATAAAGMPLLEVRELTRRFGPVQAVMDVTLDVAAGETLAIIGESGAGKSTLARALLRLPAPDAGTITFGGTDFLALRGGALRAARCAVQIVFQDADAVLDPRMTVGESIAEGMHIHRLAKGAEVAERVGALLEEVGLDRATAARHPHQLSGGQRQRVGIARALAVQPSLLVLDEPVSALDAPHRAQVLALLRALQRRRGIAYLFIAHDLEVVRDFATRVAVMYLGRIVEEGPVAAVLESPCHPYTRALVRAAAPARVTEAQLLPGDPPSPRTPPSGCAFHPRCAAMAGDPRCQAERPVLRELLGRRVACHHAAGHVSR